MGGDPHEGDRGAHPQQRAAEAGQGEEHAAGEEADALERVLAAGEERDPAKQRAPLVRHEHLERALGAHLGQILATPGRAWTPIAQGTESAGGQSGRISAQAERQHLQREPPGEGQLHPEARRGIPAEQVGEDAEELVEQEERRELERRVAQRVKVQQHQHAQRAVSEREGPVGGGDDGVVAEGAHRSLQARRAVILP